MDISTDLEDWFDHSDDATAGDVIDEAIIRANKTLADLRNPNGFTWEMVDAIREIVDDWRHGGAAMCAPHFSDNHALEAADKIALLLPPRPKEDG